MKLCFTDSKRNDILYIECGRWKKHGTIEMADVTFHKEPDNLVKCRLLFKDGLVALEYESLLTEKIKEGMLLIINNGKGIVVEIDVTKLFEIGRQKISVEGNCVYMEFYIDLF